MIKNLNFIDFFSEKIELFIVKNFNYMLLFGLCIVTFFLIVTNLLGMHL